MRTGKRIPAHPERAARDESAPVLAELPESVQLFEASRDVTFAADSGVMIQVWRGRPTVPAFERLERHYQAVRSQCPRFAGLVVMDVGHIAPPEAPARQRGADLIKGMEKELAGLGFVIEGTSFKYNVLRFSLTTIALLSSSSVPQPVFATVAEACAWLGTMLPSVTPHALEKTVAKLRALPPRE